MRLHTPVEAVDWTDIADIRPERRGRGYSTFGRNDAERIRKFWQKQQIPVATICAYFDVPRGCVYNIIHRRTKCNQPRIRTFTEKHWRWLGQVHHAGMSMRKIAGRLGINAGLLQQNFRKRGLNRPMPAPEYAQWIPQVHDLLRTGKTQRHIARELGVSRYIADMAVQKIRKDIERSISNGDN